MVDLYRVSLSFPVEWSARRGRFPVPRLFSEKKAAPSVSWCLSSGHARKPSAKETPAAPLPGARSKASSPQAGTGTGHAAGAQGSPCPDQTQPDGRSPAQGRAGGVQRGAAESNAWGLPSAGQPRPARKNPRRAVHPAQRGTCRHACSARREVVQASTGRKARQTKPGTRPGRWCAAGGSGHHLRR